MNQKDKECLRTKSQCSKIFIGRLAMSLTIILFVVWMCEHYFGFWGLTTEFLLSIILISSIAFTSISMLVYSRSMIKMVDSAKRIAVVMLVSCSVTILVASEYYNKAFVENVFSQNYQVVKNKSSKITDEINRSMNIAENMADVIAGDSATIASVSTNVHEKGWLEKTITKASKWMDINGIMLINADGKMISSSGFDISSKHNFSRLDSAKVV